MFDERQARLIADAEARIEELDRKIGEAKGWGAALSVMDEERRGLLRFLMNAQMTKAHGAKQRRVVLVDIDHTISDAFWRDPMIGAESWDDYHAAAKADEPLWDTVFILQSFRAHGYSIVGITARPEKWRALTMRWLLLHNVPMDELLMRANDDYRPSKELKPALAVERFGATIEQQVSLIIDDREDVCVAFRNMGIAAFQIHAVPRREGYGR